jgi:hypothetical protein
MKRHVYRASVAMVAFLAIALAGVASALLEGCGATYRGSSDDGRRTTSSPPPIDLLAPDAVETASFGFG